MENHRTGDARKASSTCIGGRSMVSWESPTTAPSIHHRKETICCSGSIVIAFAGTFQSREELGLDLPGCGRLPYRSPALQPPLLLYSSSLFLFATTVSTINNTTYIARRNRSLLVCGALVVRLHASFTGATFATAGNLPLRWTLASVTRMF